jgi:hypothetical protein
MRKITGFICLLTAAALPVCAQVGGAGTGTGASGAGVSNPTAPGATTAPSGTGTTPSAGIPTSPNLGTPNTPVMPTSPSQPMNGNPTGAPVSGITQPNAVNGITAQPPPGVATPANPSAPQPGPAPR